MKIISENLPSKNLHVDSIYGGSRNKNASDDALSKLIGVDNSGGFRYLGKPRTNVNSLKLLVLLTDFADPDWPDNIDYENGLFTYYGDKREPGDLHDTGRDGNQTLRNLFDFAHSNSNSSFPLILLFCKTGIFRDVRFLGLAVPGAKGMSSDEDLTAVWRATTEKVRFQNYRAIFTILDVPTVSRQWIIDAQNGNALTSIHAPEVWLDWINKRKYFPLTTEIQTTIRSKKEQIDLSSKEKKIIELIYSNFKENPIAFEAVAAELIILAIPGIHSVEITRPWRDGGRDALGKYRIYQGAGGIDVDFAMEAKCYSLTSGVGVKEVSRLISRLRHRQFGILVTTSYLAPQAYQELITDNHPVVVLSAVDIGKVLLSKLGSFEKIDFWLKDFLV